MNTGKIYYDSEGNECSIVQMVEREPHWAANRIQEGEKAISDLAKIADVFNIGENARSAGVILTNIENASRRADCLSLIESYHTKLMVGDDGEEYEDSLLNWGESPEKYIETYKHIIRPAKR